MAAARYGAAHQRLRTQVGRSVDAGLGICARCRLPIVPGEPWDLDHDDENRHEYIGPSHRRCNRKTASHAAQRRAKRRADRSGAEATGLRWSRHWYGGFDQRCPVCRATGAPCPDADPVTP